MHPIIRALLQGGGASLGPYTKLLLHCNGANGSTTFTDEAGKTVAAGGNAQISTAQYKFGSSSAYLDGNGDYLSIPNCTDFNYNGNAWTFDCQIRPSRLSYSTYSQFIFKKGTSTTGISIHFDDQAGTRLRLNYGNGSYLINACTLNANAWQHIEVGYDGSKIYFFVEGTLLNAGGTAWTPPSNVSDDVVIGAGTTTSEQSYQGYIDEIRWLNGSCAHTSTFTPPTSEYTE